MRTIYDIIDRNQYATNRDFLNAATARVAAAYGALFSGVGGLDDAALVLVDLAQHSRYYDTASIEASPHIAAALDQRRANLQRILEAMAKSGREPVGLLTAVLQSPDLNQPDSLEEGQ